MIHVHPLIYLVVGIVAHVLSRSRYCRDDAPTVELVGRMLIWASGIALVLSTSVPSAG
jgi:hypothetical protein